jgi:hypothetical protein
MSLLAHQFDDVILSGGTGRSGTTIIGKLLSRHSSVALSRPAEVKILTSGNGLLDLHLGKRVGRYKRLMPTRRLHLERFRYRLYNHWWERESKNGNSVGLQQGIEIDDLNLLFNKLKLERREKIGGAERNFYRDFVNLQKNLSGKDLWIDTTPPNIFRASEIAEFLPGVRFIHMVRDGRDVISSVIREPWGPSSYEEGLVWYRRKMRRSLINSVALKSQVLTLSLEALVIEDRENSLKKILNFLGLEEEPKFRAYFDSEVIAQRVNRGRWQDEVKDLDSFNDSYFKIVTELKEIEPEVPLSF